MADFGYMGSQQVEPEKIISFKVTEILMPDGEHPVFFGRLAGEANKPYFNQVLKSTSKQAKEIQAAGMSSDMLAENRDQDRELFPKCVLTDWKVVDADGKAVKFNSEDCAKFLATLPDHVFDRMRNYFATTSNFMGKADLAPSIEEAVDKGKS